MSQMKTKLFFGSIFLALFFSACEKIEDPFPRELGQSIFLNNIEYIVDQSLDVGTTNELNNFIENSTWTSISAPDNSETRFVLLEEFTGHKCTFCPRGTREIVRLDGELGDTLIPVGIHAGGFALPNIGASSYFTDFRVEGGHGETYNNLFQVSSYPSGVVSRLGNATGSDQWSIDINSLKNEKPKVALQMTNYYALIGQKPVIRSNISITWLKTLPEDYNLQLYLLEDHIIDWQLDLGTDKSDYDHRHVLRKVINDTFGKALENAIIGETETIEYIFEFDPAWKADDIEVVAFIFKNDDTDKEVVQANATYIK